MFYIIICSLSIAYSYIYTNGVDSHPRTLPKSSSLCAVLLQLLDTPNTKPCSEKITSSSPLLPPYPSLVSMTLPLALTLWILMLRTATRKQLSMKFSNNRRGVCKLSQHKYQEGFSLSPQKLRSWQGASGLIRSSMPISKKFFHITHNSSNQTKSLAGWIWFLIWLNDELCTSTVPFYPIPPSDSTKDMKCACKPVPCQPFQCIYDQQDFPALPSANSKTASNSESPTPCN